MLSQRTILLLLFFPGSLLNLCSQPAIDSTEVYDFPVKKGIIYEYDQSPCWRIVPQTCILTTFDSVFHFEEGEVVSVFYDVYDNDYKYAVIIRNRIDEFFCYSNLKYAALKKGDRVKRGTWLGLTGANEDGKSNQVDFILFRGIQQLSFKNEVEYIRCYISSDKQEGYTL